jgi:hypothetical protein
MQKLNFRALFLNKNLAFKNQQSFVFQSYQLIHKSTISFLTTTMQPKYVSKYYSDINSKMPPEYSDYENYENAWG